MPITTPTSRDTTKRRVRFVSEANWYEHPQWYDILHAPGTAGEVRGMERIARHWLSWTGIAPLTIFEPACGTARHLRIAADRGHRVIGLDCAEPMLTYAQASFDRNNLDGTFVLADMRQFDVRMLGLRRTERVDLAFCPVNSIRHLMTDADVISHLRATMSVLTSNGLYAVGIGLTEYGIEQSSEDIWEGARGQCKITQVVQYLPGDCGSRDERIERVVSHLTIMTPTEETHVDHTYQLRRYDTKQWRSILRRAGLDVVGLVDEAGATLDGPIELDGSGYAIYLLRPQARP